MDMPSIEVHLHFKIKFGIIDTWLLHLCQLYHS